MPNPHSDQQTGWFATLAGALGLVVGGTLTAIINQVGGWRQELIRRRTATEQREQDRDEAFTDNLRGELDRLTIQVSGQETRILSLIDQREKDSLLTIEREAKIRRLEGEMEDMRRRLQSLTDQKANYEVEIDGLRRIVAEKDALISDLRRQLADAMVIGTAEVEPPRRLVARDENGE